MVAHQSLERNAETRTRPMLWTIRRHFASSYRLGREVSRFGGLVMLSSQPSWQYFCCLDRRTAPTWPMWSTWPDIGRPSSRQWPAWPCPRREVTGQSTMAVTMSRILQRVQRSEGQCKSGRCRGQTIVLTGAVLTKARARIYLGRKTSVCVLCCRPRGMLEAASSAASDSASFGRVPSHC